MLHLEVILQSCGLLICGRLHDNIGLPFNPDYKNETVKLPQDNLNLFTGSAREIGGKISASKTKWYLLEFLWDTAGKWRLADHATNLTIDFRDGRIPIQWLLPSQTSRILWVWIASDGYSQKQTTHIRKITTSWADRVRSGHTRRENAWHYFQTTIKK